MRTLPCRDCGRLYTDNISKKVNLDKGGYIVCTRCATIMPQQTVRIEKREIKWKKKAVDILT